MSGSSISLWVGSQYVPYHKCCLTTKQPEIENVAGSWAIGYSTAGSSAHLPYSERTSVDGNEAFGHDVLHPADVCYLEL